ncbi:GAF domain-containing protein [Mucilaginibacter polytrichastri]|uniref:GAF domain-containing protein n=1 Tax=Mucilaginibacter polytrichastri TaxID=1302689 RepID=A0A1Q6A1M9_9SPHI|nr:GAF domain-containing protein [Mucilaginibacter polytrichastri]OKS87920.1 hypothetical protein RG47T_3383 [Mucilaginibacter polytrichastri]SFT23188.1 hypothetical protein SAMN04487890_12024 [Mucilaginibacter polytrichastri]
MMLPQFPDSPFQIKLSFHKIIEMLEETAATDGSFHARKADALLQKIAPHPELRDGIADVDQLEANKELIHQLLDELFPPALSLNEIKAVSIPFLGLTFNYTKRFQNILKAAGTNFEINIRDFDYQQFYIMSCCIILNAHYGTNLDFSKPLFYDIPTAEGVSRHYRILYNADFLEITATDKSVDLSEEDIMQLMNNYDDLALWKEKFPPGSWSLKGFAIMTLYDATTENALSILKGTLLGNSSDPDVHQNLESIFRSIFNIADMHIGFTAYEKEEKKFTHTGLINKFQSYILPEQFEEDCQKILRADSYQMLIDEHRFLAIADVDEMLSQIPESNLLRHFQKQNIKSFILAPVVKNGNLLGLLELVSCRTKDFNSVTAKKLDIVMPFIVDTLDRKVNELQNQIQAVIQNNYTTLHPSVHWKFKREAKNYILSQNEGIDYTLKEIKFKDVYPLYGQIDIKDSSVTRNASVKNDLINQLTQLVTILEDLNQNKLVAVAEQQIFDLKEFIEDLTISIKADTEQQIQNYLRTHIYPILENTTNFSPAVKASIETYFYGTDPLTGQFNSNRRDYEKTLSVINEKMVAIMDKRQLEIQRYFPHYFERFKTDGVEHNLYIGNSITPNKGFDENHLQHLRLWQLQVLSEMAIEEHYLKARLPYHLGVTGLLLVFSTPIAIRFRMDEKHFDVDGAYNIRYEVIKKRIDKAHVKDSIERITQQGKITIVYTKHEEAEEYKKYIALLQAKRILAEGIEQFDIEDLQGVSGLKALRVSVLYEHITCAENVYSYDDLYEQLNEVQI